MRNHFIVALSRRRHLETPSRIHLQDLVATHCKRFDTVHASLAMIPYLCGLVKSGVIGVEFESPKGSVALPTKVRVPGTGHEDSRVGCSFALGPCSSAAVSQRGDLFSVGLGAHGRTGLGKVSDADRFTRVPTPLRSRVRFAHVQAGGWHCLARTATGRLYQWGYCLATLGNSREHDLLIPTMVPLPASAAAQVEQEAVGVLSAQLGEKARNSGHQAVEIMCGANCSGYIDRDGALFTWGSGPLGIHDLARTRPKQRTRTATAGARSISGPPHQMIATIPTRVIIPIERSTDSSPRTETIHGSKVSSVEVRSAHLGHLHGGAVTKCGRIWMWGSNESGCIGLKSAHGRRLPVGSYGHMLHTPLVPPAVAEHASGATAPGESIRLPAVTEHTGPSLSAPTSSDLLGTASVRRARSRSEEADAADSDDDGEHGSLLPTGSTHGTDMAPLEPAATATSRRVPASTSTSRPSSANVHSSSHQGSDDGDGGTVGTKRLVPPVFVRVSCSSGTHHPSTLAVDAEGYLWGWGSNFKGKLGGGGFWTHGDKDAYPVP